MSGFKLITLFFPAGYRRQVFSGELSGSGRSSTFFPMAGLFFAALGSGVSFAFFSGVAKGSALSAAAATREFFAMDGRGFSNLFISPGGVSARVGFSAACPADAFQRHVYRQAASESLRNKDEMDCCIEPLDVCEKSFIVRFQIKGSLLLNTIIRVIANPYSRHLNNFFICSMLAFWFFRW